MTLSVQNQNSIKAPARPESDPVGIGLRHPYYQEVIDHPPAIGWFEIHPENYFGGGPHHDFLDAIADRYPLGMHAVGLSLGSDQPLDKDHLRQYKELIDRYNPFNISDHASWSASGNAHLNDLLPLPYTQESLDRLARNVETAQNYFGRTMLIENPSTYLSFEGNHMHEDAFMNNLASMTGCQVLLDINNIYVQAHNHDFDAWDYIDTIETRHVGEIHLAGHTEESIEGSTETILIDTHNAPIRGDVWDLYAHAVKRFGAVPTLIEWDQDFPDFAVLLGEADKARHILNQNKIVHAHAAE